MQSLPDYTLMSDKDCLYSWFMNNSYIIDGRRNMRSQDAFLPIGIVI